MSSADEILKSEEQGMVSLQVRYVTIVVSTLPMVWHIIYTSILLRA